MEADTLQNMFAAVRKACNAHTWSRGIELVRASAVTGVSSSPEEIVCRVKLPQRIVASNVTLYPEDEEWDCDCGSRLDPCECIAASTIAMRRAREQGDELPQLAPSQARLVYRFARHPRTLALERIVVRGNGDEQRLEQTLVGFVAKEGALTPNQVDLNVDRALGGRYKGALPLELLWLLLERLADAPHVELDGKPIQVASRRLAPHGHVSRSGDGFTLELRAHPELTEVVAPRVALAGDTLHLLSDSDVTGANLERLPDRRYFGPEQVSELVTEVIPALKKRFALELDTDELPEVTDQVEPRVLLDVQQQGHELSILPTLVYGDPPLARIDAGQLVHLGGAVPVRNEDAERRLASRLRDRLGLSFGLRANFEGDSAAHFAGRLERWQGEIQGDAPERFVQSKPLVPRLELSDHDFSLRFEADDGSFAANAEQVLAAWRAGDSMVPLIDGGWSNVPSEWLAQHGHRVAELLAAREPGDGELSGHGRLMLAEMYEELGESLPEGLQRLRPLLEGFAGIPSAPLPEDLKAELRPYQRQGVDWLVFLRELGLGATLADDMGLGKTLQTLCAIRGRTLVVCPRSVVYNWADEIAKFRPDLRHHLYHGPGRSLDPDADVTLTTYAILRLDIELLRETEWDAVVLDEAQTIKNPDSQVSRAAYDLRAHFKVTLSGTPVENRLEELWSQLHFTNRGLLGGRQSFAELYANPIGEGHPEAAARLRRRIAPFLMRRLKSQVATELPPRTDVVLHCELSDDERAIYDAIRAATQKDVLEQLQAGGNVLRALESLLRLRQACCHTKLLPSEQRARRDAGEDAKTEEQALAPPSSKLERLIEALTMVAADGHKALVFSQWTSLLDLVEPHLQQAEIRFNRLDGSTRDRGAVVNAFQDEGGPSVMLLSLKAGGTGLNLTAADHVFLLDPWWNPAVEDQAADRAHRIGQDQPVMVYRLVAKDTVEERILELQQRKRQVAGAALGEAEQAGSLTRDDLAALLA